MFSINWLQKITKALITGILVLSLISCSDRIVDSSSVRAATPTGDRSITPTQPSGSITEVSPPEVIQELRQVLETHQPQVKILAPQLNEVLQDDTITAQFQVQDLPIFKNQELDMGPHLHVILDNQPYIAVYDLSKPLVFPDLPPGTHTLRVFASRPWHESFKNEGAYAQTTFHILTKTEDNNPKLDQPLLTYSRPKGSYGAEPILLDFYLTNAPLHLIAQNSQDEISDWRIRCTINGNSFVLDRWQPIYLKGFKPGENWVQLEFLDEKGNSVSNVFNNTARLITYEPKGTDTLSKLVRGELTAAQALAIVDPNITNLETTPTPTTTTPETPLEDPNNPEANAETDTTPAEIKTKKPGGFFNRRRSTTTLPPTPPEANQTAPELVTPPEPEQPKSQLQTPSTETTPQVEIETKKPGGFFNRRRRSTTTPSEANQTAPELVTPPEPEQPEPQLQTPSTETTPQVEPNQLAEPQPKSGGFFNRFRRPSAKPSDLPPTPPEITEPLPEVLPPETTPQIEISKPESSP